MPPRGRKPRETRIANRHKQRNQKGIVVNVLGPTWTHGKRSTYVAGCQCDECTEAESAYQYKRNKRGTSLL